ncbi:MAG TPA: hypothetical protein VMC02_13415 [Steroidobacteraceae bacterium]|nr:hypothetical protein [Steroidobacteraceae bacterium]
MNTRKPDTAPAALGLLVAGLLGLAGCASLSAHLPFRHKPPPAPEVSTALTVATPEGVPVTWPQVWQRNDVVLDMSTVSGEGAAVVMPRSGLAWPVRVALRISRGAIGSIDVHGAQRLVVPIPAGGAGSVDIELPPGLYVAATKQLTLKWGPAQVPAGP